MKRSARILGIDADDEGINEVAIKVARHTTDRQPFAAKGLEITRW